MLSLLRSRRRGGRRRTRVVAQVELKVELLCVGLCCDDRHRLRACVSLALCLCLGLLLLLLLTQRRSRRALALALSAYGRLGLSD